MKSISRFAVRLIVLAGLVGMMTPALAQNITSQATPEQPCEFTASKDVAAYWSTDTSSDLFGTVSAGDGGIVAGVTPDNQWIGFDPGVAQAANMGLTRLRWIQNTPDIQMQGNCSNLPNVEAPPPNACVLTFGTDVNTYTQPDTNAPVYTTLGVNDYAQVVGMQGSDWYAWASPGAQAGATGTISLRWAQVNDPVQLSGNCDNLPTFYPAPKLTGDICTVLTKDTANSYGDPDTSSDAQPVPGVEVQVLAQTADHWLGYDPGDDQFGTVGINRLRWIQADDVDQMNGDCQDVPVVDAAPVELWPEDSGKPITLRLGDTLIIRVPASSADEWTEAESSGSTNDHTIMQMQGQPQIGPSGDRFGSRAVLVFTYQAIGVGETTISLTGQPDSFSVPVTVENAARG